MSDERYHGAAVAHRSEASEATRRKYANTTSTLYCRRRWQAGRVPEACYAYAREPRLRRAPCFRGGRAVVMDEQSSWSLLVAPAYTIAIAESAGRGKTGVLATQRREKNEGKKGRVEKAIAVDRKARVAI